MLTTFWRKDGSMDDEQDKNIMTLTTLRWTET